MSHLTKYTHKPISVKARVIGIFIKENKQEQKKRKRKSDRNKPPIKKRIFILEDVTSLSGEPLLSHSFIYDENINEFQDIKHGDSILFNDINFFAFGKPEFEHDSTFQLEYSHTIEFNSTNIKNILTDNTNKYAFKIPNTNKIILLDRAFDMSLYKTYRDINQGVSIITNTTLWDDDYEFEYVREASFMNTIKSYISEKAEVLI